MVEDKEGLVTNSNSPIKDRISKEQLMREVPAFINEAYNVIYGTKSSDFSNFRDFLDRPAVYYSSFPWQMSVVQCGTFEKKPYTLVTVQHGVEIIWGMSVWSEFSHNTELNSLVLELLQSVILEVSNQENGFFPLGSDQYKKEDGNLSIIYSSNIAGEVDEFEGSACVTVNGDLIYKSTIRGGAVI